MMTQDSTTILITYSRSERALVDRLETDLRAQSFQVDRSTIEGTPVWNADIRTAIEKADVMLVVLSPDTLASKVVQLAYTLAEKLQKKIIPLLYYSVRNVPHSLARLQGIDFQAGIGFEEQYQQAFPTLATAIREPNASQPATMRAQPSALQFSRRNVLLGISLLLAIILAVSGAIAHYAIHDNHTNYTFQGIKEFSTVGVMNNVDALILGPDNNVWFTKGPGNQVGHYTANGQVAQFTMPTRDSNPLGIASGADGNLWVTEEKGNKIGRVYPTGEIDEISIPTKDSGPTEITLGADGNHWFSESQANQIGRITDEAQITEFPIPTPGSLPHGLAIGPDGNIWFAEEHGNQIGRITATGKITEYPIPTKNSGPIELSHASDFNLWFTESQANQIGRINKYGQVI